ncbi:hypothetical protein SAMN06295888_13130 [Desulfonatronum zhilinae]|nr:hypothetical protein SAMN06295888_13130 [Desulfonatronum zhilinae]
MDSFALHKQCGVTEGIDKSHAPGFRQNAQCSRYAESEIFRRIPADSFINKDFVSIELSSKQYCLLLATIKLKKH